MLLIICNYTLICNEKLLHFTILLFIFAPLMIVIPYGMKELSTNLYETKIIDKVRPEQTTFVHLHAVVSRSDSHVGADTCGRFRHC